MYGALLDEHIRRTNRNLLALNVVCIGIVTVVFALGWLAFRGGSGPQTNAPATGTTTTIVNLTSKDLINHPALTSFPGTHIRLSAPNAIDLEWPITDISQRKQNYDFTKDKYTYHLVPVDGRYLLVLPGTSGPQKSFVGELTILEERDKRPVETVVASRGQPKPGLLPYALNCLPGSSFPFLPAIGSVFGMLWLPLLLLGVPTWNVVKALQRRQDPTSHPIVRMLARYGPAEEVGQAIQAEARQGRRKIGEVVFTQNWAIVPRTLDVMLIPLENLVWVYEKVRGPSPWTEIVAVPRQRRTTTYGEYVFYARRREIATMIDYIGTQRPWLIMGWTPQIRSDMLGRREDVIAYVDERRRQYLAGQGVPAQHGVCPPRRS